MFDAQNFQKSKGLPLLDTNIVNILTSTFSDNSTYIAFNSKYHLDELIEKIQLQFDVTSKTVSPPNQSIFYSVDTPKAAIRAFWKSNISIIALINYIYVVYKENRIKHPWYLIPISITGSMITTVYILFIVLSTPNIPFMQFLMGNYNNVYMVIFGIAFCSVILPYEILKLFWLYYLSPIYQKCERNPSLKVVNCIVFLGVSLLVAFITPMLYIMLLIIIPIFQDALRTIKNVMDSTI